MSKIRNYVLIRGGNLALRLLSMGAKFLLVAGIAKSLGTEQLGEYGLFTVAITMLLYFIGFDFYTFSSREILGKESEQQKWLFRDQFVFHILSYILILPLIFLLYLGNIVPIKHILVFISILIFEHFSQELYRIFVLLSRSLIANFLLFIRTGLWCYITILAWVLDINNTKGLEFIYIIWAISSFLSIIVSLIILNKIYGRFWSLKNIDWHWVKKGILVSFPFFISTICYKIIEFSNRYIIDFYTTKQDVGVFVFFSSIANASQVLIYTIVIMIFYPKMITLYNQSKFDELNKLKNKFYIEVVLYSVLVIFMVWCFIDIILAYMDKMELSKYKDILWFLLVSVFFINLSYVPHYQLYVHKKDKLIRNITIFITIMSIPLNVIMIKQLGIVGAAYAYSAIFIIMHLIKYFYSKRIKV